MSESRANYVSCCAGTNLHGDCLVRRQGDLIQILGHSDMIFTPADATVLVGVLSRLVKDILRPEARASKPAPDEGKPPLAPATAPDFLREAAALIDRRASERDLPAERSMRRTVTAFAALTGQPLTETQGWLFMAVLKLSRASAGAFQPDDLLDCAAYVALGLESETQARG
jgi:hypothetical protein